MSVIFYKTVASSDAYLRGCQIEGGMRLDSGICVSDLCGVGKGGGYVDGYVVGVGMGLGL